MAALNEYWRSTPPVHVSVASYLQIGGKSARNKASVNQQAEAASEFGPARERFVPRVPIQGSTP